MSELDAIPQVSDSKAEKDKLFQEIKDVLYLKIQMEVIRKYFALDLQRFEGNTDRMLQESDIFDKWVGSNSSPASKYSFIFTKIVNEAIGVGDVTKLSDVSEKEKELADVIYNYIRAHDASWRFNERYEKLVAEGDEVVPMGLENYKGGENSYGWVYNLVQTEIVWSKYKNSGGPEEMANIEDWGNSSSLEYDKAMRIMISFHGEHLLQRFYNNFYKLVGQLESIINNIRDLEATIEAEMHFKHTKVVREHILEAIEWVTYAHPQYISNMHMPDIRKRLVLLVEEELGKKIGELE
jgi:hypothetical protein